MMEKSACRLFLYISIPLENIYWLHLFCVLIVSIYVVPFLFQNVLSSVGKQTRLKASMQAMYMYISGVTSSVVCLYPLYRA